MNDDTQSGSGKSLPQMENNTTDRSPYRPGSDRTRSDPTVSSGQRPPVNDDTGSLASRPATFAHTQDKAEEPAKPTGDDQKESASPAENPPAGSATGLWLCAGLALGFVAGLALLQASSRSGRYPG